MVSVDDVRRVIQSALSYYYLKEGEEICEGDECDISDWNEPARWVPATCIGDAAPDPRYPAHRAYRRRVN